MGVSASPFAGAVLHVRLADRVEHGTEVRVLAGGQSVGARVGWLGGFFHQLRCDGPLALAYGDPIVMMLGERKLGGVVLDPEARRQGPSNELLVRLTRLWEGRSLGEET
jgi:hypothetical protein